METLTKNSLIKIIASGLHVDNVNIENLSRIELKRLKKRINEQLKKTKVSNLLEKVKSYLLSSELSTELRSLIEDIVKIDTETDIDDYDFIIINFYFPYGENGKNIVLSVGDDILNVHREGVNDEDDYHGCESRSAYLDGKIELFDVKYVAKLRAFEDFHHLLELNQFDKIYTIVDRYQKKKYL